MTLKCVCVLVLLCFFSFQFQIKFAHPIVRCVYLISLSLSLGSLSLPPSLFYVEISDFVCFESVSGCLSLNIFCYYKFLQIARVHRSRRYYHIFFSQQSTPTLLWLPSFRYMCVFCLVLCYSCASLRRDVYSVFT